MSEKNTGGPAFPVQEFDHHGTPATLTPGMTMRDYFAAKALSGLLAGLDRDAKMFLGRQSEPSETMAKACYSMADAMIAERNK